MCKGLKCMNTKLKSSLQLAVKAAREAEGLGLTATAENLREIVSELTKLTKPGDKERHDAVVSDSLPHRSPHD